MLMPDGETRFIGSCVREYLTVHKTKSLTYRRQKVYSERQAFLWEEPSKTCGRITQNMRLRFPAQTDKYIDLFFTVLLNILNQSATLLRFSEISPHIYLYGAQNQNYKKSMCSFLFFERISCISIKILINFTRFILFYLKFY